MDVYVTRNRERFVWDSNKAASNIAKHGISFDQAIDVFFDPFYLLYDASVEGEGREAALGQNLMLKLLYVVHTELDGDYTRVISARDATGAEMREYEDAQ